jgi:flagellar motor switch protein FliG
MADLDYSKLTRQQKLAVFLIVIGPEAAAEVLRQFDDAEVEQLCREMSACAMIPAVAQRQALEEFSALVAQSAGAALGGASYAHQALGLAKGDQKATAIMDRVGPAGAPVDVIKEIGEMEAGQIFNLLKSEQPQTISFILSYLDGAKAAAIFALLDPEVREEVIERLGTIEATSLELVGRIARSFGRHIDTKTRPTYHRSGGVRAVADLVKLLDKETSKALLVRLDERNAALSAAIRKKLFGFEDLNRLTPSDLQRALREVDSSNLAIALKSASEGLRGKIYAGISKRAAESLKEEIEMLGSVRLKDVEAAQDAIIQTVRRLEEEGHITLEAEAQSVVA